MNSELKITSCFSSITALHQDLHVHTYKDILTKQQLNMNQFQIFLLIFFIFVPPSQVIQFSLLHINHLFDHARVSLADSVWFLWCVAPVLASGQKQQPPLSPGAAVLRLAPTQRPQQSLLTWFLFSTIAWFECWQQLTSLTVSISHCENLITSCLGIWILLYLRGFFLNVSVFSAEN